MADQTIRIKAREAKTLRFLVKENDILLDLTGSTAKFYVSDKERTGYIIQKDDVDFDKTQEAAGVLRVDVDDTESDVDHGTYIGELQINFTVANIDKSADIDFIVEQSVI